jgi:hypothetical protein
MVRASVNRRASARLRALKTVRLTGSLPSSILAQGEAGARATSSGVTSAGGKSARRRSDRPRRRFAAAAGITRVVQPMVAVARIISRRGRSVRQAPAGRFSTPRSGSRGAASPARGEASCPHPSAVGPTSTDTTAIATAGGRQSETHGDPGRGKKIARAESPRIVNCASA